jgi:hypothetical protein
MPQTQVPQLHRETSALSISFHVSLLRSPLVYRNTRIKASTMTSHAHMHVRTHTCMCMHACVHTHTTIILSSTSAF